jgi:class 3 adenylate cyclase
MMRHADPATYLRFEEDTLSWDVTDLAPLITAPTLVLHPRSHRSYPAKSAQRLAALIPNAELQLIDTSSVLKVDQRVLAASGRFLMGSRPQAATPRATVAILFLDIADSTAITERIGDQSFREQSRALDERLRGVIAAADGRAVEGRTLGDGVLATFRSAQDALNAARRCVTTAHGAGLPVHAGIHAGDVIRESDNVYGGAVNIAARICGLSRPGEILVSGTIRDLARTSAGVTFEDRGEHALKGIDDPVRVWAVLA